jgi:hypothetical protein
VDYQSKYLGSIPGPGQYEGRFNKTFSTLGASLDHSQRQGLTNKMQAIVPGPGRYEPSPHSEITKNDQPKFGFGTGLRADLTTGTLSGGIHSKRNLSEAGSTMTSMKGRPPGPGAYEIKGVIGNEGPKRSLAGRFKIDLTAKELNQKPGPGAYSPSVNCSIKQSPAFKVGTSTREKYYLKDKFKYELPPPNIYDPDFHKVKQRSPATGLGYGDRSSFSKTFQSPGPGAYKSPSAIGEGPTYVLGARLENTYEIKKAKEVPSPNLYNPKFEAMAKTQSVFSIGKSLREEISGSGKLKVPGPGAYLSPGKATLVNLKDSPKWGFGSSARPDIAKGNKTTKVPGPGAYKLKSTFADVPSYLIPN